MIALWCLLWVMLCVQHGQCTDCRTIANNSQQLLALHSAVMYEGCRWRNASVQMTADGPFQLTLYNVILDEGTLVIRIAYSTTSNEARSSITIENSILNCTDCVKVVSDDLLRAVDVRVGASAIHAKQSALVLVAQQSVADVRVRVRDSTVEATCDSECHVVSIRTQQVVNVLAVAVRSQLRAVTSAYSCGAMAVTHPVYAFTVTATNVTLYAIACVIQTISTGSGVCSFGFASDPTTSGSINATNVTLYAVSCEVAASGRDVVSSVGFACMSASCTLAMVNLTIYAVGSNITTTGHATVTSLGFVSSANTFASTINAVNTVLYASHCNITTIGQYTSSSLGFASFESGSTSVSTISLENVTISAVSCQCTTRGISSVASLGIASNSALSSRSTVTATNLEMSVVMCNLVVSGQNILASLGLASSSGSPADSFIISRRAMICCCESTVSLNHSVTAPVAIAAGAAAAASRGSLDTAGTRWVLVRSRIYSGGSCVTMAPSMDRGISVASDVVAQCALIGWSTPAGYCSNNVTWTATPSNTLSPADKCPASSAPCSELLPPQPFPPLNLGDDEGSLGSLSDTLSLTNHSAVATATRTSAATPTRTANRSRSQSHLLATTRSPEQSASLSSGLVPVESARSPISRLLSSEAAAKAIIASGTAAAALAGITATTSVGHATRMGAIMQSVVCAFAADELDPPSAVSLPLQFSIGSQDDSLGSHAGSALLTSALLVVLPLLVCGVVHRILSSSGVAERQTLRSLQCNVVSRYCWISVAFFVPNVLMSATVVVGHGASTGLIAAALCAAIVPLVVGVIAVQSVLKMDVDVVPLGGGKWELKNRPSSSAYVETFGGLIDGCRDPNSCIVRVCALEDIVASLVLSFLSGVSASTASCEWVALAMVAVSALHLLYVAGVRPLRSRIESALNYALCSVQVLMAVLCLAIASGADNSGGVLMTVLGAVGVVQNVSFFAQAAILAACAWVSENRKRHTALSDPDGDAETLNHALLTSPDLKQLPLTLST